MPRATSLRLTRNDLVNALVASFLKLPGCDLARSLLHVLATARQSSAKCEGSIMPEIASMPTLTAAPLPASGAAVTLNTPAVNPTGAASTLNGAAAGLPGEAATPAVSDAFANILQRQMARVSIQPLAGELVAQLAGGVLTDSAAIAEFRARLTTDATANAVTIPGGASAQSDPTLLLLTDAALATSFDTAANTAQTLERAANTDRSLTKGATSTAPSSTPATLPGTALVADLNVQQTLNSVILAPGSATRPLTESASIADRPAKPAAAKDDQQIPGDNLTAALPFVLASPPSIRLDANLPLPATGKRVSTESAFAMPSASQTQGPTSKLLDIAANVLHPDNKAADFAGMLAVSADASPDHPIHTDATTSVNSFESALAAAQFGNPNHVGESRGASHTASPLEVKTPVGARGWDGDVGDKLVWMVNRQEQRAELVLNPPQLGRVEVSLSMNGDQTTAQFVSSNPVVREALEAALPRLREMFADAGMSLGQAQVGADSSNNASNQENRGNSKLFSNANDSSISGNILRQTGNNQWLGQGSGLVNVFA